MREGSVLLERLPYLALAWAAWHNQDVRDIGGPCSNKSRRRFEPCSTLTHPFAQGIELCHDAGRHRNLFDGVIGVALKFLLQPFLAHGFGEDGVRARGTAILRVADGDGRDGCHSVHETQVFLGRSRREQKDD